MLAAGTAAQASSSALGIGLPVLAPTLRAEYGLSLGEVGILGASWVGSLVTLLPWGLAADRLGERAVLTTGLAGCAVSLVGAAYAPGFAALLALLVLAGAAGGSVNSASGEPSCSGSARRNAGSRSASARPRSRSAGSSPRAHAPRPRGCGRVRAAFLFLAALCAGGARGGRARAARA